MDPNVINAISTLGFPIVACIALFVGCKYMLDKANTENREAIKACTEAINKLCDKLERLPDEK